MMLIVLILERTWGSVVRSWVKMFVAPFMVGNSMGEASVAVSLTMKIR
ncbi:hypothetical protein V466_08835 [Pseudomonas mandelii PD30]|uniref:Uncharacterized protein n=1 Tax=Pseudomonas mandelii PD30 TaxID=1419583 RepID=A0A059L5S7_9PSED|nr:hypothetical protein V466_08835 [Pseudomonas mandelii PD30]